MRRIVAGAGIGLALGSVHCEQEESYACTKEDALVLFGRRIAPLLSDDRVTSCNECHLSGVDLSLYAGGDPCTTMACMVESGIVDLESPDDSVVLDWILRSEPGSELITPSVIRQEHDAVLEWIEYNARCDGLCPPVENPCARSEPASCPVPPSSTTSGRRAFEDPGDCDETTIEAAFGALVYSWRGRCSPCHFDSFVEESVEAPRWIADGECNLGALQTMRNVIDSGLLHPEFPEQSLLVLKPLNAVPHGGHQKMHDASDPAYQDFVAWIRLWAACR